jgi:signal transduction histidine kinase
MKENARAVPPGRPFHLLAQVPPPAHVPAVATRLQRADLGRLPATTMRQLSTVLRLCQCVVDASAAELVIKVDDGWVLLARVPHQESPRGAISSAPGRDGAPDGRYVVLLPTTPALAMTLLVSRPVTPDGDLLLREALEVAALILRAGDDVRRIEQTRRHVLDVQAELAHELRTPLTAISGFAQLLQRPGNLDEARRRSYAGIAVTESQQATAIIDNLVATLEAEAVALNEAPRTEGGAD